MDGAATRSRSLRWGAPALCALMIVIASAGAVALAGCGGTSVGGATSSPMASAEATTDRASPVATPTTPAEVAAAFAAALDEFRSPIGLFAGRAHLEDRSIGDIRDGVKAIRDYRDEWTTVLAITSRSHFGGSDGAIVEEKGESSGTAAYAVNVLRVRGGKITAWYVYYSDWLSNGIPTLAPALLKTPPRSSDTEKVSRAVAGGYMSALRTLAPTRLASLYAPGVVYQDTSRDARYVGPSSAVAEHARMFALKGVRFRANGVVAGPGWAAVMWRRTDREGGTPPLGLPPGLAKWGKRPTIHGVSILEIRAGEIARETIYCDHIRTTY
jgi:hypothetical protein